MPPAVNTAGRPPGLPPDPGGAQPAEPFVPDLSEGAETGVYLALLELLDEGLIITGDELILDANSAACQLLGRDYREVAGRPLSELFPSEEDFLAARARLFIEGERRGQLEFALPGCQVRTLSFISAPRLRPGMHAVLLSAPTGTTEDNAAGRIAPDEAHAGEHPQPRAEHGKHPAHALRTPYFQTLARTPGFGGDYLERGLYRALHGDELTLHFQPLVDARDGRICAGEALLRWRHPELGLLPFRSFIGAVNDRHLISELGDWVLQSACRVAREWPQAAGGEAPRLTVNVALEQLLRGDFAERVAAILRDSGLPAERLELDLDERVLEVDSAGLPATLDSLAAQGLRLAIDDFGRGLSSIPRLRRYPVTALKLDPALVAGVGRDEDSEAIVEAISCLAAPLGLKVYARGVESRGQQAFLCALGCHLQQGPLFGQPVPAAQFGTYPRGRAQ